MYVRVNVDIDVPLFLPLYGQRRLRDLQNIAIREKQSGVRIRGQMNFDSGWEWGYWLNDVITARASWNPFPDQCSTDVSASNLFCYDSEKEMDHINVTEYSSCNLGYNLSICSNNDTSKNTIDKDFEWKSFAISLQPLIKIYPSDIGERLRRLLVNLTFAEAELLLFGKVDGKPCPNIAKLTGIAYMSGVDTWVDLPRMMGLPLTQPDKIHMGESWDADWEHIAPLLMTMETTFTYFSNEMFEILEDARRRKTKETLNMKSTVRTNKAGLDILRELYDCIRMLSLRASQIRMLYESSDPKTLPGQKAVLLTQSRSLLSAASTVVNRREQAYRVPWQRVAAWRDNPTVYRFGYLWSVHSLYYWWRDQGLAEQGSIQSERSPCYLNRMDASEVVVGWGKYTLEFIRYAVHTYFPFLSGYSALEFLNCIAPPEKEYLFPQDLYNY